MNITLIILGVLITYGLFMVFNNMKSLVLVVESRGGNGDYLAMRKTRKRGYQVNDWNYYDKEGEEITDERLKNIIFDSFANEDWYSDIPFYAEDINYLETLKREEKTKVEAKKEKLFNRYGRGRKQRGKNPLR